MPAAVFEISNLQCEYLPNRPVLKLNKLHIPRGQLIFVIGKSGIGKSTFIETLGLMNNTIAASENTSLQFFPDASSEGMELKNSWSLPNARLSEFRRKYFSFIFQNTNLMPNFTAGENMMMSLLIKGRPMTEAKAEVLGVMEKLSLGPEVFDKKITALSGGQRQRLAFVRSVTAEFSVLFGDEPTGNLDENTASELMGILKKVIKAEQKTGIIVSHDLRLACEFADMVIPITTVEDSEGQRSGVIEPKDIIQCKEGAWYNGTAEAIEQPKTYLHQFLNKAVI